MRVLIHVEDARYNGIRPSHFDGVRMACDAFGIEELAYVDLTEDGFYMAGFTRYLSFDEFLTQNSDVLLLTPDAEATVESVVPSDWLAIGPSMGFTLPVKQSLPGAALGIADIEPRDALMIALARL